MKLITEDIIEKSAIELLQELGWEYAHGREISPEGLFCERDSFGDVLLVTRLREAITKLNPSIPLDAQETAIQKLLRISSTDLLHNNEIVMLDKVQKKHKLSDDEEMHLKNRKLIEGRRPDFYISLRVAKTSNQKAKYSKNRAFDKAYYLALIEKAIREHGYLERSDVDELLWEKLPDWMDDKQRKNKITNLLSELRRVDKIYNTGSDTRSKWLLKENL